MLHIFLLVISVIFQKQEENLMVNP